ncbi:hypothetical protein MMC28_005425 [Mycoblastus sanguinarius]|nr:hypothetical protein [Mycoblastus sanguinarius]
MAGRLALGSFDASMKQAQVIVLEGANTSSGKPHAHITPHRRSPKYARSSMVLHPTPSKAPNPLHSAKTSRTHPLHPKPPKAQDPPSTPIPLNNLAPKASATAPAIGVVALELIPTSRVNYLPVCIAHGSIDERRHQVVCIRVGANTSLWEMEAAFGDVLCSLLFALLTFLFWKVGSGNQRLVSEGTAITYRDIWTGEWDGCLGAGVAFWEV